MPVTDPETGEVRESAASGWWTTPWLGMRGGTRGRSSPGSPTASCPTWTRPGPGTLTAAATYTCPACPTVTVGQVRLRPRPSVDPHHRAGGAGRATAREGDRRGRRGTRPARRTHPGRTPHGRPGRSHRPQPPDLPLPPHPHPRDDARAAASTLTPPPEPAGTTTATMREQRRRRQRREEHSSRRQRRYRQGEKQCTTSTVTAALMPKTVTLSSTAVTLPAVIPGPDTNR